MIERLRKALSDRYDIDRELGAGGMATVYLASDLKHDRRVAVNGERAYLGLAERLLASARPSPETSTP